MKKTVKDLLREKGSEVWVISPQASVYDAIKLMAKKGVGALVVQKDGELVGMISERDYARKVILEGRASSDTPVGSVMADALITTNQDASLDECMALVTDNHIRHLPVVDGGRLLGIISIGDLVKAVIALQQSTIDQLEQYISG